MNMMTAASTIDATGKIPYILPSLPLTRAGTAWHKYGCKLVAVWNPPLPFVP